VKIHLNTLFVSTDGAYLAKEGLALTVRVERRVVFRSPIHTLDGVVCFGRVGCSPAAMALCAEHGVSVSFCAPTGRLLGRVLGFTPGNVLLRREQFRRADSDPASLALARPMVQAKIANSRAVLLRAARDAADRARADRLSARAARLAQSLDRAATAATLDELRGVEGEASRDYFAVFNDLFTTEQPAFTFPGRTRRPPLDPVNALLSFLYAMLAHDARSACEIAGLDPQVGFLHRDRPGRPSLALDLIEELRAFLVDRLVVSLINRRQVSPDGFATSASGAVIMTDAARRTVLAAYQRRKQDELIHPFIKERVSVGLIIHLQARLLSRHLRGDLDAYPPFIWK